VLAAELLHLWTNPDNAHGSIDSSNKVVTTISRDFESGGYMLSHSDTVFVSRMPLRNISMGGGGRRAVGQGGAGRHVPLGQGMASGQGSLGGAGVVKQGGVDDGMQGRCLHVATGQDAATKVGQEVLPARASSWLEAIWAISLTAAITFPLDPE
jgi:hypothetical protein